MADVLLALNKYHFALLCRFMNDFVAQEGFPTARVTRDEKEQFARKILTYVIYFTSKRFHDFKIYLFENYLLLRNNRKTVRS